MKKLKLFFIIFLSFFSFTRDFEVNDEATFVNAIRESTIGDKIIMRDSFVVSQYYGTTNEVNLNGITIEGNNHKLEIINLPLSLSGDTTLKNVKLNLSTAGGIEFDGNSLQKDDTQPIYANGYNLILDNVTTDYEGRRNTAPTIFMGSKEGFLDRSNRLEIKNSDETNTKFKDIFAGNEKGTKIGKSEIILDENVRITGYNDNNNSSKNSSLGKSTLKLNNKEIDSDLEVSVVNKSRWIAGYDTKGNENVDIELVDNQMFTQFKTNGKLKNLTIKGNTTLLVQDTPLQVENLKLVSLDNSNPEIKVSHPNASVRIDNLNSNSEENKVSFYDSEGINLTNNTTSSFEFKNLEGSFKREGGSNTNIRASSNSSNNNGTYTSNVDNNNEEDRLSQKKSELLNKLDTEISSLNQNQKNKLKEEINSKNDIESLEEIKRILSSLDDAMNDLNTLKRELENQKNDTSYSSLSENTKNESEVLLNKFNDFTEWELEKITELKTKFNEHINKVSSELENIEDGNDTSNSNNEDIENKKQELKNKIDNQFSNLNEVQKNKLKEEVDIKNNIEELDILESNITNLNLKMNELNEKKIELETLKQNEKYENLSQVDELKNKVEELLNKFNNFEEIKTIEKLNELKVELENIISKLKEEFEKEEPINDDKNDEVKLDLSPYYDYLTLFNYNNTSISKNFNEKTYFNINLGKGDKDSLNNKPIIAGLNLGFNIDLIKYMKIGGFLEYEKNKANHILLGTNFLYKDFLIFTRYRLSIYENLLNHNIDTYLKYNKKIKVLDNFSIIPSVGTYLSYSHFVNIDEKVVLDRKVSIWGDIESKIEYIIRGINLYLNPGIKFGYNKARIYEKNNPDNKLEGGNDYFVYYIDSGIEKEFNNGLNLKFNILLEGNEKAMFRVKNRLGISYNWY